MKPRAEGGVVDSRLSVYGTQNLKCVDLSICPVSALYGMCFAGSLSPNAGQLGHKHILVCTLGRREGSRPYLRGTRLVNLLLRIPIAERTVH